MSRNVIEWCGICWLSGARSLSDRKVRKLPICDGCYSTFGTSKQDIDALFGVWDRMPDYDERSSSSEYLSAVLAKTCSPKAKDAIEIVERHLEWAKDLKRGGQATAYLESVLDELRGKRPHFCNNTEEEQNLQEEMKWLVKGKKTLQEIRGILRQHAQALPPKESVQATTLQTS